MKAVIKCTCHNILLTEVYEHEATVVKGGQKYNLRHSPSVTFPAQTSHPVKIIHITLGIFLSSLRKKKKSNLRFFFPNIVLDQFLLFQTPQKIQISCIAHSKSQSLYSLLMLTEVIVLETYAAVLPSGSWLRSENWGIAEPKLKFRMCFYLCETRITIEFGFFFSVLDSV